MNRQDNKAKDNKQSPGLEHSPMPLLLTEDEVIELLRIPEISKSADHRNVIENLRRIHDLPCIHICRKPLYPLEAVRQWILEKAEIEQKKI
jgi:hypothetical protein